VKWKSKLVEDATWEDEFIIRSQFPSFSLGDKADSIEGGNVREYQNQLVNGPRV